MNPDIKAQWIAALRSGDYQQTEGQLRSDVGYCCLGVLCDLHAKAGLGTWEDLSYDGMIDILPDTVVEWAELVDDDGDYIKSPEVDSTQLVDLNDGVNGYGQRTFAEIADLIEEFL